MKTFLTENFLLESAYAQKIYHDFIAELPIIDYHCHLAPDEIASNRQFTNMSQIWLEGDHYKWRAMRTHGVPEKYCTGEATDEEKFKKWAETVPYTMRNPLYHWTHMELQRPFGIEKILGPDTAEEIYIEGNQRLQEPSFTTQGIIQSFKVEVICTTDDPTDSLEYHKSIRHSDFPVKVLPTFRPDRSLAVEDPDSFNDYIDLLGVLTNVEINHFIDLLDVLKQRMLYFHDLGCRLSDHGLDRIYAKPFNYDKVNYIFHKIRLGNPLEKDEKALYKSALLHHLCELYHELGWTQQFHLGAMRNNNSRMMDILGPDTGFDSIGDYSHANSLGRFLDRLDKNDQLAKTILYNLNPKDNEVFATMTGNFNDGSIAGKVQFGSGWWFLDQKDGMERQMNALSNMGLISHFVGMLTDSRSFLSYPRHDYFRRILCNLFGQDIAKGLLPNDIEWIGHLCKQICYYNARSFFGFFEAESKEKNKMKA